MVFAISTFMLLSSKNAEAKVLPRFKSGGSGKTYTAPLTTVAVSPRFRSDRRALNVYFSGLNNASSVTYSLTYDTNGKTEGVGGTIKNQGNAVSRELVFGTYSSGYWRYHTNITNMKFEVVSELNSGQKAIRRYKIRI